MKIQLCVKFCWFCLRYIEAIDMNKKLGSSKVSRRGAADLPMRYSPLGPRSRNLYGSRADTGVPAKTMLTTRDLIINSVAKSLPSVTRELADYCNKEKSLNWRRGKLRFQLIKFWGWIVLRQSVCNKLITIQSVVYKAEASEA